MADYSKYLKEYNLIIQNICKFLIESKDNIISGYNVFINNPEKTEVIVQVYVLNPLFEFLQNIVFFKIRILRKFILFLQNI